MKKFIVILMLMLPLAAISQTSTPIHEYADVVFFCKGNNLLDDAKNNIVVEHVAIYDSLRKAVIKIKGQPKEIKRDIETPLAPGDVIMYILGGDGGCIAISFENLALMYSPYEDAEYVAFDLDMEKMDNWTRQTGKIK